MTYDEYIDIIVNSNREDWKYDDERESYLFLSNISIMMKVRQDDSRDRNFEESWAERYTDKMAYVHVIELYYNGMRIDDFYTALVDKYRMCIPYPKRDEMTITKEQYSIGNIVNIPYCSNNIYNFDDYLRQAGIAVKWKDGKD